MMVSRLRPESPILMLTESERVARSFALVWGVTPVVTRMPANLDEVFAVSLRSAKERGMLPPGKLAVVTAGFPIFGTPTNLVYIHRPEDGIS